MASKLKLDHDGIAAMLQSALVAAEVNATAHAIAANVKADAHDGPVPVRVSRYEASLRRSPAPRPAGAVTLAHPAGLSIEAKHGVLVRAASAAGYEVKARHASGWGK